MKKLAVILFIIVSMLTGCISGEDKTVIKDQKNTNERQQNSLEASINFINHLEKLVDQRKLIHQKIPSPINEAYQKNLQEKYREELKKGNFNPQTLQKEVASKVSEYIKNKQAYTQNINNQALSLQTEIGNIPKEDQALAKKALDDFITLTQEENRLFELTIKVLDDFSIASASNIQTKEATSSQFSFITIANTPPKPNPKNCNCQVIDRQIIGDKILITTRCECEISVQLKKQLKRVTDCEKASDHSLDNLRLNQDEIDQIVNRLIEEGLVVDPNHLENFAARLAKDNNISMEKARNIAKLILEGNAFNRRMRSKYPHNEVYVEYIRPKRGPDKKIVKDKAGNPVMEKHQARVDSYRLGKEIVSRKYTQLSVISKKTAKGYINELVLKYPAGAKISNVPTQKKGADHPNQGLAGQTLHGQLILEVPVQKRGVPSDIQQYAKDKGVTIRDENGTILNP